MKMGNEQRENNRKDKGLNPQHLTAIKILQKITSAVVIGAEIGSTELKFIPGEVEIWAKKRLLECSLRQ